MTRIPLAERADPDADAVELSRVWIRDHPDDAEALTRQLAGVDAVINAAGRAEPDARDEGAIWGSNVLLPIITALLDPDRGAAPV